MHNKWDSGGRQQARGPELRVQKANESACVAAQLQRTLIQAAEPLAPRSAGGRQRLRAGWQAPANDALAFQVTVPFLA